MNESKFEVQTEKPFYFQIEGDLYYSANGKLDYSLKPIWRKDIEKAYVSPNSQYVLIYEDNELTLIDNKGEYIFTIDDCTNLEKDHRKSGRFLSSYVQWSKDSDFFLIAQDSVWNNDYSHRNTNIYKYLLKDKSFKSIVAFNHDISSNFYPSHNETYLYYLENGGLKKLDIRTNVVVAEYLKKEKLKLENINSDSIFINYEDLGYVFDQNSYDLQSIITDARTKKGTGLYFKNKDTIVNLLFGTEGFHSFKKNEFSYFREGFFLAGNRYFIANISAENFEGQLVIDTKTFQIMKLKEETTFYFNINSIDCADFVLRYSIGPNFKFATHESIEITESIDGKPKCK